MMGVFFLPNAELSSCAGWKWAECGSEWDSSIMTRKSAPLQGGIGVGVGMYGCMVVWVYEYMDGGCLCIYGSMGL